MTEATQKTGCRLRRCCCRGSRFGRGKSRKESYYDGIGKDGAVCPKKQSAKKLQIVTDSTAEQRKCIVVLLAAFSSTNSTIIVTANHQRKVSSKYLAVEASNATMTTTEHVLFSASLRKSRGN
jgi:hypothetical protein